MDASTALIGRALKIPFPDYCLVGRWVRHMPRGVFAHASIAKAASMPGECAVGWIAHYAIGAIFALAFLALVSPAWLGAPSPLPALLFGLATVALPFLVLHPAFGLGIAASRAPSPRHARLRSVLNHALFGLGLYLAALLLRAAGPA
jgi:hypothetical protein